MLVRSLGFSILVSLGLAGCGGTAAPAPGTSAPQPLATVSARAAPSVAAAPGAPSDALGGGDSGSVIDLCTIVTAADVEALYPGTSITATEPLSPDTGISGSCSYSFQPEDEGLTMEVISGDQAMLFWNGNIPPQGDYNIPLSGIGTQAMREPGDAQMVSISGMTFCEIEPETYVPELYSALVTPGPDDVVPDASATAIAQKLGTLCNKVFATI